MYAGSGTSLEEECSSEDRAAGLHMAATMSYKEEKGIRHALLISYLADTAMV